MAEKTFAAALSDIIRILERELTASFIKFGYGDSDMLKQMKIYRNEKKGTIVISFPQHEIFLEYGTKYIKKPKRIVNSALRKARPQINDVLDSFWDDFLTRAGSALLAE